MRLPHRFGMLFAAIALLTAPTAGAEDWPSRPVKMIVSYPAGGSADAIARPYADALSKRFGQPFVIENRAGAAGAVGTEAAARSAADGYTLFASPNPSLVLLPQIRQTPYDPRDFVPVAGMGSFVYGFSVLPSLGPKTLDELIALARRKPGSLTYASPGSGSVTNLRGEALKVLAGIDMLHVPYRTGAESLIDFLGGRVDVMIDSVQFPHVKAGKALLLAVTSDRRHPDFPDVPTVAEAGYPIDLPTWAGIYVPRGTPAAIIDRLAEAMREIVADPEMQERVLKIGFFPMTETPAQLAAAYDRDVESYSTWVRKTGLKIE